MRDILTRRCQGLEPDAKLFQGVSADHLSEMAVRAGAPKFMLHDLRKLLASVGKAEGISDAVLRRMLNHTPPKSDTLNRHYISADIEQISAALQGVQLTLLNLTKTADHAGPKPLDSMDV